MQRCQCPLFYFLGICVFAVIVLAPRVWGLRALYLDKDVRNASAVTMKEVAAKQGWLISDMKVLKISKQNIVIHHTPHTRWTDLSTCYVLSQSDFTTELCE